MSWNLQPKPALAAWDEAFARPRGNQGRRACVLAPLLICLHLFYATPEIH